MAQTENLTVMFTDIVGFTERTSQQSRAQNRAMLRDHNHLLLPLVARFGGRRVKSIGDSLMLGFHSPTDAVRCGMAMHDALAEYNFRRPESDQIHIRVAINVGEVRIDGNDIFGEAVNVASRVEGLTPPDQIYFTEAVYLAMNKAEVSSTFAGRHKLKGIPEPVKLFTVPPRQVNRLVPGGEDMGDAPGEFPFGGMHRAPSTVGRLATFVNVVRSLHLPTMDTPVWRARLAQIPLPAVAMPPPRRMVPLLFCLFMTLALAWFVQLPPEEEQDQTPARNVAETAPPPLESNARVASDGDPTTKQRREARAWLQKAHAAYEHNHRREAAPAYGRALELEPALENDPLVATRLVACLSWASDLATPLIRKHPSAAVVAALAKRTWQAEDLGGQRAADLLTEIGHADRIDPYFSGMKALSQATTCEAKRAAIAQVRGLHDPRSLPALQALRGHGISGWFKSSCYRSEAQAAIEEIQKSQAVSAH